MTLSHRELLPPNVSTADPVSNDEIIIPCDLEFDCLHALSGIEWDLPLGIGPLYSYEDVVHLAMSLVRSTHLKSYTQDTLYEIYRRLG